MIDHLIYGVPDLDAGVDDVERRFGVRAVAGGKHLGLGTHNALLALGSSTYLELIAPDPDQPPPQTPRPFGVDELTAARLLGWAVGCADIDAAIATARVDGYDPGDAIAMTRTAPDGSVLHWRLTLNAVAGGAVPFLIDWGETPHPASTAPAGLVLEHLRIEHPAPDELRATLRALGSEVNVAPGSATSLVATIHGPDGAQELR